MVAVALAWELLLASAFLSAVYLTWELLLVLACLLADTNHAVAAANPKMNNGYQAQGNNPQPGYYPVPFLTFKHFTYEFHSSQVKAGWPGPAYI